MEFFFYSFLQKRCITFDILIFFPFGFVDNSLVGAIAVTMGLYIVLWGKAKEHEVKEETTDQVKKQNDDQLIVCDYDKIDLEDPLLNKQSAAN